MSVLASEGYRKLPRISFKCPACGHQTPYALKLEAESGVFVCEKCQARAQLKHSFWFGLVYCSVIAGIVGGVVYWVYREWFLWAPVIAPIAIMGVLFVTIAWFLLPAFSRRFYLWTPA
jgi:hypothetical protein